MKHPLRITFRNVPHSDEIEAACHKYTSKLEHHFDRITDCHVVISAKDGDHGRHEFHSYHLTLNVPGAEFVVSHDPDDIHSHEEDRRALYDAFDRACRRLDDFVERRRERERTGH
jgi:ribosome-associated translation inhibitor RaiA